MLFYLAVDGQTYDIIGAALQVHRLLGPGFLEAVYKTLFRIELARTGEAISGEAEISEGHLADDQSASTA